MLDFDLTPFGFTPTENLVYRALLEFGPSGGYSLAKKLNVARANTYQALNGLVSKHAATTTEERPQRYRAARPDALFSRLATAEARKLDALEAQMLAAPAKEGAALVPIEGRRGIVDLALRTAARESGPVSCLAPPSMAKEMTPAWRRRAADGRESVVWIIHDASGEPESVELPIPVAGYADAAEVARVFTVPVFLLVAGETIIAAQVDEGKAKGYWSTDPIVVGLAQAAVAMGAGERVVGAAQ
jgi:sugar-specific transcriptional regulator TrmB